MHIYSPLPTIKCMSSCVIFENFSDDIASVCMDKLLEGYTHSWYGSALLTHSIMCLCCLVRILRSGVYNVHIYNAIHTHKYIWNVAAAHITLPHAHLYLFWMEWRLSTEGTGGGATATDLNLKRRYAFTYIYTHSHAQSEASKMCVYDTRIRALWMRNGWFWLQDENHRECWFIFHAVIFRKAGSGVSTTTPSRYTYI